MARSVGRPKIILTQEQLDEAESLAAAGCTHAEIADSLGFSETILYERKLEFPEFTEALRRGKNKGIATASNKLFALVEKGDLSAIKYFLNNRARDRWRDKWDDQTGNSQEEMEALGRRMREAFEAARIIEGVVVPDE